MSTKSIWILLVVCSEHFPFIQSVCQGEFFKRFVQFNLRPGIPLMELLQVLAMSMLKTGIDVIFTSGWFCRSWMGKVHKSGVCRSSLELDTVCHRLDSGHSLSGLIKSCQMQSRSIQGAWRDEWSLFWTMTSCNDFCRGLSSFFDGVKMMNPARPGEGLTPFERRWGESLDAVWHRLDWRNSAVKGLLTFICSKTNRCIAFTFVSTSMISCCHYYYSYHYSSMIWYSTTWYLSPSVWFCFQCFSFWGMVLHRQMVHRFLCSRCLWWVDDVAGPVMGLLEACFETTRMWH